MPARNFASQLDCMCDVAIDDILQLFDTYIFSLVKKELGCKFSRKRPDYDIDDVVQRVRIKLWRALQRGCIHNMKAYIGCIVHTECIDIARRDRHTALCSELDESEVYQELQNPFEEVESKEIATAYMSSILDDILSLPACQQYAVICSLKEEVSDTLPLMEIFMERGLDIQNVIWPAEKKHLQTLRSSLSIARKKLRAGISIDK